jgi:hypothetical protein
MGFKFSEFGRKWLRFTASRICFIFLLSLCNQLAFAQFEQTKFNGFGHQELSIIRKDSTDAFFSMGEHDFFVSSNLSKRISFLGEYVIRFNTSSSTSFLPSIERSFIRFNYINNHSIIAGKVHTPVNYWNDVYHHGRVFFPVIDRPFAFTYLVPLHTLGLQFQGQNLGPLGLGYDFMLGNGIASTDNFQGGFHPSITAAVHVKPIPGLRLGASYYYNQLSQNKAGTHIGHAVSMGSNPLRLYKGPLNFQLYSTSLAWFGKKLEFLNELSVNRTRTDSLGIAFNFSQFTYLGYRFNDNNIPFVLLDYIKTSDKDLHVYQTELLKLALGYRYEFNYLVNIKAQIEQTWSRHSQGNLVHPHFNNLGLRIQMAYGF